MPLQRTVRFKLAQGWLRGEDFWGDPVTMNFIIQDALLFGVAISMTEPEPPVLNAEGDMYLVPAEASGLFAGQSGKIAYLHKTGWVFIEPVYGLRVRLRNPAGWYWYTGPDEGWREEGYTPGGPPQQGTRYDVNISVGFEAQPADHLCCVFVTEPMILPQGAAGSGGRAVDWPGAVVDMTIRRNNSPVGTIRWTPGLLTAEVIVEADVIFAQSDLLTVVMPNDLPDGFQNYGITLRLLLVANGG